MKRKIIAIAVIFVLLTIGPVSAMNPETRTYTSRERGFSIEYPTDWLIKENKVVSFSTQEKTEWGFPNVTIASNKLSRKMNSEEYAKVDMKTLEESFPHCHIVEKCNTTINGSEATVVVYTVTDFIRGEEKKSTIKSVFIIDNTSLRGYIIRCGAGTDLYEEADKEYFEPMIMSFNVIARIIEVQNFRGALTKIEKGKKIVIRFDVVNVGTVEDTKTFNCSYTLFRWGRSTHWEKLGSKTVTLAPGESEHIEYAFAPSWGKYFIIVKDAGNNSRFGADIMPPWEAAGSMDLSVADILSVSGFELAFAIAVLLAMAFFLRQRG